MRNNSLEFTYYISLQNHFVFKKIIFVHEKKNSQKISSK